MSLKDIWIDKVNGVDDIDASDINNIAQAVIDLEETSGGSIEIDAQMSDTSENAVQNKVIKTYVDGITGDIETALDSIIAIENELMGGDTA